MLKRKNRNVLSVSNGVYNSAIYQSQILLLYHMIYTQIPRLPNLRMIWLDKLVKLFCLLHIHIYMYITISQVCYEKQYRDTLISAILSTFNYVATYIRIEIMLGHLGHILTRSSRSHPLYKVSGSDLD